jgi:UTP-glucose-1-phosphate uridylyltransferase
MLGVQIPPGTFINVKPTLVIMAAGMGSRYGGLKQIDPIGPGGEIVIDYSIFDALRAGFGKVVFIIRKDIEATFREVIEPHVRGRIAFDYVYQELDHMPAPFVVPAGRTKPWGTTHAILSCRAAVKEPFAVINADDFYGRRSFDILAGKLGQRRPDDASYLLVGFLLKNTLSEHGAVSRGICEMDAAGRLKNVAEHPKIERHGLGIQSEVNGQWAPLAADTVVSMNMWGFTPALFPQLEGIFAEFLKSQISNPKSESYIPAAVDQLVQAGQATVEIANSPDTWLGMTYPEDKPAVRAGLMELIRRGEYPEKLWH